MADRGSCNDVIVDYIHDPVRDREGVLSGFDGRPPCRLVVTIRSCSDISGAIGKEEGLIPAESKRKGARDAGRRRTRTAASPEAAYHHGDLRRALVEAALALATDGGPVAVSVREAARRAGVSPGAPFRHFASRDALLAAAAAEAQRRFRLEIDAALAACPDEGPLQRFRALGLAYVRWAVRNPAHFEIISTASLFDHDASGAVADDNAEVIALTERLLAEAAARGELRDADLKAVQIAGRALVYGLARMKIDGHLPRWGVASDELEPMAERAIDVFLDGISRR